MKSLKSLGYVTPRDYNSYIRFNLLRGKYYRLKSIFLSVFIALICLAFLTFGLAYGNKTYFMVAGILVLCVIMFFYTLNLNIRNTCNKNAKIIRAKQRTQFGKNGFVFELLMRNEEENEYSEILYDEIDNIYLAPKAIYIYIDKRSVIVIPKRNLEISPSEAYVFLRKFVPDHKLVVCV